MKTIKNSKFYQDSKVTKLVTISFVLQESLLSFSYPVVEESDSVLGGNWSYDDEVMKPYRTVMVIPASRLEHSIREIERTLQ